MDDAPVTAHNITIIQPDLTLRDRIALAMTRAIGKPALYVVGNAKVIRAATNGPAKLFKKAPRGTRIVTDDAGGLHITPPGVPDDAPYVIHIHGGGFLAGSPYTHLGITSELAVRAGLRAYIPTYSLAPEHPFPAGRNDLIARYKAHVDAHGAPAALIGDSAGGNLALLVAQHARDHGWPLPRALGLMSPVADLSDDVTARVRDAPDEMLFPARRLIAIREMYFQGHDPRDPAASPLLGDLTGLPPTFVQASQAEAAAPDAVALAARMDDVRVELWSGLPHVWHIFGARVPVANAALQSMASFLEAHR